MEAEDASVPMMASTLPRKRPAPVRRDLTMGEMQDHIQQLLEAVEQQKLAVEELKLVNKQQQLVNKELCNRIGILELVAAREFPGSSPRSLTC